MKIPLLKEAKNTMKLGVFSLGGMGSVGVMQGAMGNLPNVSTEAKAGMASATGIIGTGLNLANIGQLAKTGMSITKNMNPEKKKLYNKYI